MNLLNENCILSILVLHYLSLLNCATLPLPSTSRIPFAPSISFQDKRLLSVPDLEQSYATLSRTAVWRDALSPEVMSLKNKFISINDGKDFDIPIDENVVNKPIGTYQYTDRNGDLHIVNYINDFTGLKILNDYKPYERLNTRNNFERSQTRNTRNNGLYKSFDGVSMQTNPAEDNSNDENVDWDEVEFRFIPEVQNASKDKNNNNNKNNDLNSEESNRNVETKPFGSNKIGDNNLTQILTQVMYSIPLPQPFLSAPNTENHPFFLEKPDKNENNWGETNIAGSGITLRDSAVNLEAQPFTHFFNWN